MRKYIILFLLISLSISKAETIITGTISQSQQLTRDDSPYLINESLTINDGITLEIESGAKLLIAEGKTIIVNGRLIMSGTKKHPITIGSQVNGKYWNYIQNRGTFKAKYVLSSDSKRFVSCTGDSLIIDHCKITNTTGAIGDDAIGGHATNVIRITYNTLWGDTTSSRIDAIDLDAVHNVIISHNTIRNFPDDAIDIGTGSDNVSIDYNKFINCETGISVGESSTAFAKHNIIANCKSGIQSHTNSTLILSYSTLYHNDYGIKAYHYDNQTTSIGTAIINNCIISDCVTGIDKSYPGSIITYNYCLSNDTLTGTTNYLGDAGFTDADNENFFLTKNAMALDKANPDADNDGTDYTTDTTDQDVDGTRRDLGFAAYNNSPLLINEISNSNLNFVKDENEDYEDWIEILNTTNEAINLKGYYLSDDENDLSKYKISEDLVVNANSTVLFWADDENLTASNHLPFKLSDDGEFFSIMSPLSVIIDSVHFSVMPNNCSYGRSLENKQWVYFDTPTPLAENGNSQATSIFQPIIFSFDGGASATASLSLKGNSDKILYSEDGSNPINGKEYTTPISVSPTTTIRAIGVSNDLLSNYSSDRLFHEADKYTLPSLMLSMDTNDLTGTSGIYTNYNKSGVEWERPVSLAYYNPSYKWSANAGIRIQGGNSVSMAKKSFRLFFRNGYGYKKLKNSPFAGNDDDFTYLVLRSSYDDDITTSNGTLLRDPISVEAWKDMGEIATNSNFTSLFLNNDYWGIYNIRESINEDFIKTQLGHDSFDLIRFQKTGTDLKYGSMDDWDSLWNLFETADFTLASTYEKVSYQMNINSLLNLLSFVHCTQFRSWTWGAFAIKPTNQKWQWTIWDTDRSFELVDWNGFSEYAYTSAEKWSNLIPQKLIKNTTFQHALINRICDHLNTQFQPSNIIQKYDSLAAIIEPDIALEFERWNPSKASQWDVNNTNIKEFMQKRPAVLYSQMKNYFSLTDTVHITLKIEGKGSLKLNSLLINAEFTGVYMQDIPVHLQATPAPGYVFTGWKETNTTDAKTDITLTKATTLTAIFSTASSTDTNIYIPLVINEIMYHPKDNEEDEWIEIYNPNPTSIDIGLWQIKDSGADNLFEIASETTINAKGFYIICRDLQQFKSKYPDITNVRGNFGDAPFGFKLSNKDDHILLINNKGNIEDQVNYTDSNPWNPLADGSGASLQLINYNLDNNDASNWDTNLENPSTPGTSNNTNTSIYTSIDQIFNVYPNPITDGTFNISVSNTESVKLSISNLAGQNVYSKNYSSLSNHKIISINLPTLSSGIYILNVLIDNKTSYTQKIIWE